MSDYPNIPTIFIEDYFALQKKTNDLELRIQSLENLIKQTYKVKEISRLKTCYTYYKRVKIIVAALLFFFGKQILTHPNFYKLVFALVK